MELLWCSTLSWTIPPDYSRPEEAGGVDTTDYTAGVEVTVGQAELTTVTALQPGTTQPEPELGIEVELSTSPGVTSSLAPTTPGILPFIALRVSGPIKLYACFVLPFI